MRIGKKTTGTGVHGGDQHEVSRIVDRAHRAGDGNISILQRLPQDLQNVALEFRQLVEKEHPVVRQRNLSGLGHRASADEARIGDRMVRGAERARGNHGLAVEKTHDAVNFCRLQSFRQSQIGQYGREPSRQHGLAGPRRTDQDDIVTAGRGDFQGAFDMLLSFDIVEVRVVTAVAVEDLLQVHGHPAEAPVAIEEFHDLGEVLNAEDLDFLHHGGFRPVDLRKDDPFEALSLRGHGDG